MTDGRRWPGAAGRLAMLVAASVLAVVVAEIGLRMIGYGPRPWGVSAAGYFWVADDELGFVNRANGAYENRLVVGGPVVRTDASGFRCGLGWGAGGGRPAVVLIGDSTTFCAEVADEETGASELARRLGTGAVVLNAGVSGYSTVQSLGMLERCLARFPSIRVAVFTACANDLVESLNPVVYLPALAPHARWAEPQGTVEIIPPGVAAEDRGRPIAPPDVGAGQMGLYRLGQRSAVARLVESGLRRGMGWPPPHGRPVVLPSGAIGPVFAGTPEWQAQVAWARAHHGEAILAALVERMGAACRRSGATLFVTSFAATNRTVDGVDVESIAARAGVSYLDLAPGFSGDPRRYRTRTVTGELDAHWGPAGTAAFAAAVAPAVDAALLRAGASPPP